jgi:hypothetical protein
MCVCVRELIHTHIHIHVVMCVCMFASVYVVCMKEVLDVCM